MSDLELNEEEHDSDQEPELDEPGHISYERVNRSRFFFAIMSFLIALIFLTIYLNNLLDFLHGLLLLSGIIGFGFVGILFLQPKSVLNRTVNSWKHGQSDELEEAALEEMEDSDEDEDVGNPFESLVEEALTSIPEEFQEKMENVLVRVESEPSVEVLKRVGMKEGYTLLGLYEGVPLTAYGRVGTPEIITIYQRTIERYCGGDPDRIREQVQHTVLHEVAHHFGIDHEEMPIWVR